MSALVDTLQRSREMVEPAMRAATARLDDTTRMQVEYHLGWRDAEGRPASGSGGKSVRPALALLSASAAGADPHAAIPGAVAVEFVHNFSLLHDDLMDGDEERRHRRTVWSLWGSSSAILTGDALLGLANEVLLEDGSPHAAAAGVLLARATRDLIRGQVQDLAFEQRAEVPLDECVDMAAGKTGSLLSASAAIGAVLSGADEAVVSALSVFGAHLGIAFQLVDDVLGIWGDPAVTGKPVYSDLRARKKTLPITYVLSRGGDPARRVSGALTGAALDEEEFRRTAEVIERAGGREWARTEAQRRMELGESALRSVEIPEGPRADLVRLGRFIVSRES